MALEIDLLKQPLSPAGDTLGLETLDPRFQDIASLVEQAEFGKAAEQVEALMREGIFDIRLMGYYLYGVFVERGLAGLGDVFEALISVLGESGWPAVGPAKKKENHAQTSFVWLFTRAQKKLEAEEQKKGPEWEQWLATVDSEATGAILEKLAKFRKSLAVLGGDAKCSDQLQKIEAWLKGYQKLVYAAAAEQAAAAEAPPPEMAEEVGATSGAAAAAPGGAGAVAAPAAGGVAGGAAAMSLPGGVMMAGGGGAAAVPIVEGSARLAELLRKIDTFDALVKRQDLARAAVVAADVTQILDAFDPRLYFPKLFVKFYAAFAPLADQIGEAWNMRESMSWKAMEQLYKVDLDAFAAG